MTNRPVVATDPTGHYCVGDVEECVAHDDADEGGTGSGYQPPDPDDELSGDGGGGEYCDPVLGCENPDAGIYCDQVKCWQDGATVVNGTWEDPAVYIAGGAACLATGLCAGLLNIAGRGIYYGCLRIMACARFVASTTGITVYRVWGGYSGAAGRSWTPINPMTIVDYANQAGLPPQNFGQYMSVGTIYSMEDISIVSASPIGQNLGGLLEYVINNPQVQVIIQETQYVIPWLNH